MKIKKIDGQERDFPDNVTSAFAALARGDAAAGQQKLVLKTIFALSGPDDIAPGDAPTRLVDMMDGARWVGRTVGVLTGHGVPHTFGEKPADE